MEKGLKNLAQACRSAQKKQGTYEEGDSGVGHSDMDEEQDEHMPGIPESTMSYQGYPNQQRVPSIQNMLQQYPGPIYAPLQQQ